MDPDCIETLEREYAAKLAVATALAEEVQRSITALLAGERITLTIPVHSRVKSWASILEKISRRSLMLKTLDDMSDLVGIRVVVQFQRDLPLVKELLWRNLDVIHAEDMADRLQPDQFGYASTHFNVRPYQSGALQLQYGRLSAEVQVRTMAQHIWASASHLLQYKREADVPPHYRRALSRISAFLESSDLEFERLLTAREEHARSVVAEHFSDLTQLDTEVLAALLDLLLPRENKSVQDDYAPLLRELADRGISNVQGVRDLVNKQ